MQINWDLVLNIVIPFSTLILGKYLDKIFKPKPNLISYYGHVSAFKLRAQNNSDVYTHSIVISNSGSVTANNVRVGHLLLPPDFVVFPNRPYKQIPTATGGDEILFDKLVPKDQITISYLYFPGITYNMINSYIQSDEGSAKVINVIPSPLPNRYVLFLAQALMAVGVIALVYVAFSLSISYFS